MKPPRLLDPDAPLVHRVLAGDVEAYAEIVRRHDLSLRRMVLGIVMDVHVTEDVVQEVYWIAFRELCRFRFASRFRTWLTRIAVREALDARRSLRRRQERHAPLVPDAVESKCLRTDQELSEREEMMRMLSRLRTRERTAFVLYAEGWSYEEIADMMKSPAGSVATWIFRARQHLRRLLPSPEQEDVSHA